MAALGITFAPVFWGFMAGFSELVAGVLFWLGLAVRPAAALMMWVMFVAMSRNISVGRLGGSDMHPLDFSAGLVALLILGAGVYSLDRKFGFEKSAEETKASEPRRVAV
jgi:putative oxidoreductase